MAAMPDKYVLVGRNKPPLLRETRDLKGVIDGLPNVRNISEEYRIRFEPFVILAYGDASVEMVGGRRVPNRPLLEKGTAGRIVGAVWQDSFIVVKRKPRRADGQGGDYEGLSDAEMRTVKKAFGVHSITVAHELEFKF